MSVFLLGIRWQSNLHVKSKFTGPKVVHCGRCEWPCGDKRESWMGSSGCHWQSHIRGCEVALPVRDPLRVQYAVFFPFFRLERFLSGFFLGSRGTLPNSVLTLQDLSPHIAELAVPENPGRCCLAFLSFSAKRLPGYVRVRIHARWSAAASLTYLKLLLPRHNSSPTDVAFLERFRKR